MSPQQLLCRIPWRFETCLSHFSAKWLRLGVTLLFGLSETSRIPGWKRTSFPAVADLHPPDLQTRKHHRQRSH